VRQEGHQHPDLARVSSSLTLPCVTAQRGGVKLSAVLFRDDVLKYGRTGDISCWKWENTVFSNTGRTFVIRSHHIAFLRSQRISPVLTVPIARRPVVLNSGEWASRLAARASFARRRFRVCTDTPFSFGDRLNSNMGLRSFLPSQLSMRYMTSCATYAGKSPTKGGTTHTHILVTVGPVGHAHGPVWRGRGRVARTMARTRH
jgi:hypothetical protein